MTVPVVSRAQWGAKPWATTVFTVRDVERTEFFVHYHGGPPPASSGPSVPRTVESIHRANGWAGVGYNFVVDQAGTVYEGRGWALVGAHCPNHNRSGWGVQVAIGGTQQPTPAALASVRALYDEGCERAGHPLAKRGHRDGKATLCPGDILYAWVKAGMPAPGGTATPLPPAALVTAPLLRKGTRGRHVVLLQQQLLALGYRLPRFGADGGFGDETDAAVKALQSAARITVDGIVGPATRAVISRGVRAPVKAPPPKPPAARVPAFPGTVRRGSRGPAVRAVQQRLRDRGWRIDVDGIFGPGTEKVVRAFQAEKRLAADGIAGPATWQALYLAPL